jgi:UDP-4-amino-4,6-dideoxy-N-acetyl-beta-L-altrosamine transaminase
MKIPYAKQNINETDIESVIKILQSDWLTQGPAIERFEKAVAEFTGAKFAVAVSSATAALHLACLAAGLKQGDYHWTSPNTFVASANCGLYCGSRVDFVDINPRTFNLSPAELEIKLEAAKTSGKLPKVVIPVHFAGQSCEMERIAELAADYHFEIIEDASHAIGGLYQEIPVGSCAYSAMTVFSFHPVKIITTGEGGMVLTNREDLYRKLLLIRSHGITRDPDLMEKKPDGPWYYQQIDLGYNYRMTDIQAALGYSQLRRIDEFIARRRYLAKRYDQLLTDLPLTTPWEHPDCKSAFHLYVICLKLDQINKSHRLVFEELHQAGIMVNLHYIPVHTQPYYEKMGFKRGDFPEAERYYGEAISLPMYFGLSDEEQDYVVEKLREVLDGRKG